MDPEEQIQFGHDIFDASQPREDVAGLRAQNYSLHACNARLAAEIAALKAENDRLRGVIESKHGGESLALLDELDAVREEGQRLREALRRTEHDGEQLKAENERLKR